MTKVAGDGTPEQEEASHRGDTGQDAGIAPRGLHACAGGDDALLARVLSQHLGIEASLKLRHRSIQARTRLGGLALRMGQIGLRVGAHASFPFPTTPSTAAMTSTTPTTMAVAASGPTSVATDMISPTSSAINAASASTPAMAK